MNDWFLDPCECNDCECDCLKSGPLLCWSCERFDHEPHLRLTWDETDRQLAEWDTHLFEIRMDGYGDYIARAFEYQPGGDHFQHPWGEGEMTAGYGTTPNRALADLLHRCRPVEVMR